MGVHLIWLFEYVQMDNGQKFFTIDISLQNKTQTQLDASIKRKLDASNYKSELLQGCLLVAC